MTLTDAYMFLRRFFVPEWVTNQDKYLQKASKSTDVLYEEMRHKLSRFSPENPEVSIVIPAYNEEKTILRTLLSFAESTTQLKVELLVANNNSTDSTQEILDRCGVRSLMVREQGVAYARQAGLLEAKGTYIVNGDSDCLYPPTWVDYLTEPLRKDPAIVCTYGFYSFLPSSANSRFKLALYEWVAEMFTLIKKKNREATDVRGANFAFRRKEALAIGGFDVTLGHQSTFTGTELTSGKPRSAGRCEDGWLALCLEEKGRLSRVRTHKARIWTTDRTLMADGSLGAAFVRRVGKELRRINVYLNPRYKSEV